MGPSNRLLNSCALVRSEAAVLGGGFRRSRAVVVSGLLLDGLFLNTECDVCNSLVAVVGRKCSGHETICCSPLAIVSPPMGSFSSVSVVSCSTVPGALSECGPASLPGSWLPSSLNASSNFFGGSPVAFVMMAELLCSKLKEDLSIRVWSAWTSIDSNGRDWDDRGLSFEDL